MEHDFTKLAVDTASLRLFPFGATSITLGGLVLAVVFVVGIWWLASALERTLYRWTSQRVIEPWKQARIHAVGRLIRYIVWLLGTMLGLKYIGIDLTSVALLGSAFAVGLGFGLQNVFSNFVSGLIILLERSLKMGDFVELESGVRGVVTEIAMRYTRITTNDALDVLVPNSEFINGRVVNWTLDDSYRRMHVPFGVSYDTPKELVWEAGLAAVKDFSGVVENEEKKTGVWLIKYGDSSMDYELVVWADRELTTRPDATHARLMWRLDDELRRRNIEIPFPQRDLNIRSGTLDVRLTPPQATEPGIST